MNKDLLKRLGSRLRGALLLMGSLFMAGASAAAEDIELIPMELDKIYTLLPKATSYYEFTAQESGLVVLYGSSGDLPRPFSSTKFDPDSRVSEKFNYQSGTVKVDGEDFNYNATVDFPVEAGMTYYLTVWTGDENKRFAALMGEMTLNLLSVNPDPNSIFDITGTGQINLMFNYAADVEKSVLKCGNNPEIEVEAHPNAAGITYEIRNEIYQMLENGAIKGGEPMTLTLTGVHAASDESLIYGDDGTLVLNYICPSKPHMIVDKTIPEKFLSYWMPGDEDAKVELTFDDDLLTDTEQKATATLGFGNAEASDYYSESVPLIINGKTLSLDLSGKLRTVSAMGVSNNYGTMNLKVQNVKMADGTLAFSPGQGQLGSYSYDMNYEEVHTDFATQFTPEYGKSLNNVDVIEIWVSKSGVITYTGARFTYGNEQTIDIPASEIGKVESDGETTLTITVPETVKTADNVLFSLKDLLCIDGLDHSEAFSAKYNITASLEKDWTPESVTPAVGEYVAELSKIDLTYNSEVSVNASVESPVTVYDAAGKAVTTGTVTKVSGQSKVARITLKEAVTADGNYVVKIKEGVIGNKDYEVTGFKTGRTNPELTYNYIVNEKIANAAVRISPEDGSTVTELNKFVITYVNESNIGPSNDDTHSIYLLDSNDVKVANGSLSLNDEGKDNSLVITLDKTIKDGGTYTLHLDESVIIIGAQYETEMNEAMDFTYIVDPTSGIAAVEAAAKAFYGDVYTTSGVKVRKAGEPLDGLAKGLYIVGGRKIVIK